MREPEDISREPAPDERPAPRAGSREEFLLAALGVVMLLGDDPLGD